MKINFLIVAATAAAFTASCAQMSRDRTASRTSDMATPTATSDGGTQTSAQRAAPGTGGPGGAGGTSSSKY